MEKLSLWVEEREALVPLQCGDNCQQHRVFQKVKGTWTVATVEMMHFYIQMEFNMIQTYIYLLKHNMASRLCFYVIVNN